MNTKCVCAKGFYGEYWENTHNHHQAGETSNQSYSTVQPELNKQKKKNGVKYLNTTPEADKLKATPKSKQFIFEND